MIEYEDIKAVQDVVNKSARVTEIDMAFGKLYDKLTPITVSPNPEEEIQTVFYEGEEFEVVKCCSPMENHIKQKSLFPETANGGTELMLSGEFKNQPKGEEETSWLRYCPWCGIKINIR